MFPPVLQQEDEYLSFPFSPCPLIGDCDPVGLGDAHHAHQTEDSLGRRVSSEGVFAAFMLAFDKPEVHRGDTESDTRPRSVRECSG